MRMNINKTMQIIVAPKKSPLAGIIRNDPAQETVQ